MSLRRVSAAGRKKGIFGLVRAKGGQQHRWLGISKPSATPMLEYRCGGCQRLRIDVMSLAGRNLSSIPKTGMTPPESLITNS
jgi:hypothetical protein